MGKKNMAKCLVDSIIRRSFVVRTLNISNAILALFRGSGLRLRGFAKHTGQRLFLCPKHNEINIMRTPVNSANEAKNSNLDRTERAPKWVGVLGFILLLAAPLEDYNFARNILGYFFINLPMALFCFYATGAFDELIKTLKNK